MSNVGSKQDLSRRKLTSAHVVGPRCNERMIGIYRDNAQCERRLSSLNRRLVYMPGTRLVPVSVCCGGENIRLPVWPSWMSRVARMFGLALTAMSKGESTSMGRENDFIVILLQRGSPSPFDSYNL